MKILKKKIIWIIMVATLSIALLVFYFLCDSLNSSVTSIAFALLAACIVKLIQYFKISKNKELMKKFEILQKEERFIQLAEKSGRFTLLITIFLEFIAIFILLFSNKQEAANIVTYVAGIQSALYFLIYHYLCKKY